MQLTIRLWIVVAAYLGLGLWAVRYLPWFAIILPSVLGATVAYRRHLWLTTMICGVVCANMVGFVSILALQWVLPVVYPEMLTRLVDDSWLRVEMRLYATAGLLGGLLGTALVRMLTQRGQFLAG